MKRVFIDMDNVLVDFQSGLDQMSEETKKEYAGRQDEIPRLFWMMKPMPGAIEAVHELQQYYDLFILTTAPWNNPTAWSDKLEWVKKYFPNVFFKKVIISHHKDLLKGDFLIDDRDDKGQKDFEGRLIKFGSKEFPDWPTVTNYFNEEMMHDAHEHSFKNRSELMKSKICGCFNCMKTFEPNKIEDYLDEGETAQCPECSIDSVIGDASGFPITNEFLYKMYRYWF